MNSKPFIKSDFGFGLKYVDDKEQLLPLHSVQTNEIPLLFYKVGHLYLTRRFFELLHYIKRA